MKKIIVVLMVILSLGTGCTQKDTFNEKEVNPAEDLKEDEILVFSQNADVKIYEDISNKRQFYVDLVTENELELDDLSVEIDTKNAYEYNVEKMEETSEKEILHYRVYCTINSIYENDNFKQIQIEYADKTYSVDVGNVEMYAEEDLLSGYSKGIDQITIAASEVRVERNDKGIENYTDSQVFKTTKDITVKSVKLYNSSAEISKCELLLSNKKHSMEQEWNNEEIDIDKGTTIGVDLDILNQQLRDNDLYQGNEYIVIEYECNGTDCLMYFEVNFETALTGDELCV